MPLSEATSKTIICFISGVPVPLETIEDGFEKAIAVHEIPRTDGALLEDMGMKARKIRLRAVFYGETYEEHATLIKILEEQDEISELNHPVYGLIKGMIESVNVRHDDTHDYCEVDISFIQELFASVAIQKREEPAGDTANSFEDGVPSMKNQVLDQARKNMSVSEAQSLCSKILDPARKIAEQVSGYTQKATMWIKQADCFVAGCEDLINEVANPANSLISTIDWGMNIPGRLASAIAYTVERYTELYEDIINIPEKFMANLEFARDQIIASSPWAKGFEPLVYTAFAAQGAVMLGKIFSADEQKRDVARTLEGKPAFDAHGEYIKPMKTPDMINILQIEQALAISNSMTQDAITADRNMQFLKDMTNTLVDHAMFIKLEMERIVTINVENPTPLHLICLYYGLPYAMAARIIKLQSIRNPNAVKGPLKIYVK